MVQLNLHVVPVFPHISSITPPCLFGIAYTSTVMEHWIFPVSYSASFPLHPSGYALVEKITWRNQFKMLPRHRVGPPASWDCILVELLVRTSVK